MVIDKVLMKLFSAGVYRFSHIQVSFSSKLFWLFFCTQTNILGIYTVVLSAVQLMRDNKPDEDGQRGVIINMSSCSADDGPEVYTAYCASKSAVSSMSLPLARELADLGIRVNAIAPGIFSPQACVI